MDSDGMMERAKSRVRARGEQPFNPEHIEHPFGSVPGDEAGYVSPTLIDFLRFRSRFKASTESNTVFMDMATQYAWRGALRKASGKKRGTRPGRKKGRRY